MTPPSLPLVASALRMSPPVSCQKGTEHENFGHRCGLSRGQRLLRLPIDWPDDVISRLLWTMLVGVATLGDRPQGSARKSSPFELFTVFLSEPMLVRTLLSFVVALAAFVPLVISNTAMAQSGVSALIPRDEALRLGLEWAWAGQLPLVSRTDHVTSTLVDGAELFVTTKRGLVLCVEAETGRLLWQVRLAKPAAPTSPVGVSAKHVTVVNDSRVYVFERSSGTSVMEKDLSRAQGGPPSLGGGRVWVPSFDGIMTSWDIETPAEEAYIYNSAAEIPQAVVVTASGASWINARGKLASIELKDRTARYRFDASADVRAPLTYFTPNLFVVTTDGFAYAIEEDNGKLKWRFSTGGIISHPLIGTSEAVMIVTESGDMHVVDVKTGRERGVVSGIRQFVAATPERWYLLGYDNRLHVVDPATGRSIRAIDTHRFDWLAMNTHNGRIYMGTKSGMTQCLHEIGRSEPVLLEPPVRDDAEGTEAADGDAAAEDAGDDPGAAEEDPFGDDS